MPILKIQIWLRVIKTSFLRLVANNYRLIELQNQGIVSIGKHSYGRPTVYAWDDKSKLFIGKFCSIAENVTFIIGGEHRTDWLTTYPFSEFSEVWTGSELILGHPASKGDINIGADVWIGHGAIILSGVTIGHGAVVGAGSVVSRNVEAYSIVAGNPATHIKYRFSAEVRNDLLNLRWWDWGDEKIMKNLEMLMSPPTK